MAFVLFSLHLRVLSGRDVTLGRWSCVGTWVALTTATTARWRVCQLIGEVGGKVRVTPDTQTRKLVISFGTNMTLAVTDLYTLPCHNVNFKLQRVNTAVNVDCIRCVVIGRTDRFVKCDLIGFLLLTLRRSTTHILLTHWEDHREHSSIHAIHSVRHPTSHLLHPHHPSPNLITAILSFLLPTHHCLHRPSVPPLPRRHPQP